MTANFKRRIIGGLIALAALAPVMIQAAPAPSLAIYDPDPNHLWNRLFAVFYRQEISFNSYDRNMTGWAMNRVGEPRWVGPDVLDPPIGHHPKFLLDDEPFARCNAVLDEFISRGGATLIRDPLKRAFLQRDLWAVFDLLADAAPQPVFPFTTSAEMFNKSWPSTMAKEHRDILERKLAQAIRLLALSRAEIEKLPDTYADAIKSGAFSNVPDTNRYDILPHDLFATGSGWREVVPAHSFAEERPTELTLPEHTLLVAGRSVFRTFVKLPADATRTNILDRFAAESVRQIRETKQYHDEWKQFWATNTISRTNVLALTAQPEVWKQFVLTNSESADHLSPKTVHSADTERKKVEREQFWKTNWISRSNFLAVTTNNEAWPDFVRTNGQATVAYLYRHLEPEGPQGLPRLPTGVQFLLLREMISLDDHGQMAPTHVVESVQFRARSRVDSSGLERFFGREVELSRALLFQGKHGGLRPIPGGEPRAAFYNSLGYLRVDEEGNGPSHQSFPQNCSQCHAANEFTSSVAQFSSPNRTASIEPIARWKQENGKLDLLRQLMMASDRR